MKKCSACGQEKDFSEFNKHKHKKDGLSNWCRACSRTRQMEWYYKNKERFLERRHDAYENTRDKRFRKEYGITLVEYDGMLEVQNNKCAVCRSECESGARLSVDHCHSTGTIRGLLCKRCNVGIGNLKDSPELLREAANYLETLGGMGGY